jgi:hypothetical protein
MALPQNTLPLSLRVTFGNPRLGARRSITRVTSMLEIARSTSDDHCLVSDVIDHRQTLDDTPIGRAIEHNVH